MRQMMIPVGLVSLDQKEDRIAPGHKLMRRRALMQLRAAVRNQKTMVSRRTVHTEIVAKTVRWSHKKQRTLVHRATQLLLTNKFKATTKRDTPMKTNNIR